MFNPKIDNLRRINPGDKRATYHTYLVTFSPLIKPSVVYANYAGDAIDIYADWAKVNAPGLLPVFHHDIRIERVN